MPTNPNCSPKSGRAFYKQLAPNVKELFARIASGNTRNRNPDDKDALLQIASNG
jgi:hypothetical protein